MTDAGVLALSDSGRFDPARMRVERRERVLAAMTEDGINALLLGTAPNIRYATGARPLTAQQDSGAVLSTVAKAVSGGELNQLLSHLPSGYAVMFGKPELA